MYMQLSGSFSSICFHITEHLKYYYWILCKKFSGYLFGPPNIIEYSIVTGNVNQIESAVTETAQQTDAQQVPQAGNIYFFRKDF